MKITFDQTEMFAAALAAEQWCEERGLSVGIMQKGAPRGIVGEQCLVAKWSNLNDADKRSLIGRMTGDMRHGPVTIEIRGDEAEWEERRREWAALEARG